MINDSETRMTTTTDDTGWLLFEAALTIAAISFTTVAAFLGIYESRRLSFPSLAAHFGIDTWLGYQPSTFIWGGGVVLLVSGGTVLALARVDGEHWSERYEGARLRVPLSWAMGLTGYLIALGALQTVSFSYRLGPMLAGAVLGGLWRLADSSVLIRLPRRLRRGLFVLGATALLLYARTNVAVGFSAMIGLGAGLLASTMVVRQRQRRTERS
jgi:hypothetical protein